MANTPKTRGGFNFDLGFDPTAPREIQPLVNQLSAEVIALEKPFLESAFNQLRTNGLQISSLKKPTAELLDLETNRLLSTVHGLMDQIESSALASVGEVGVTVANLTERAPQIPGAAAGESLASLPAQGAAPGSTSLTDLKAGVGVGIKPPAMVKPIPFLPFPAQFPCSIVMNCVTGNLSINYAIGTPFGSGIVSPIIDAQAWTLFWDWYYPNVFLTHDPCIYCTGMPVGAGQVNFCDKPKPVPPLPPAPPVPPVPPVPPLPPTPPTTPPKPCPPTTPCPPPAENDCCVWIDPTGCKAQAMPCSSGSPGNGWVQQGAAMTTACCKAVAAALNAHLCPTPPTPPGPPGAPPVQPDPICDPIGYCQYQSGGAPWPAGFSMGKTPFADTFAPPAVSSTATVGWSMSAILASIAGALMGAIHWGLSFIDDLILGWKWPKCPNPATLVDAHINLGIMDWMARILGPSFKRLQAPSRYIAQITCPLQFPSAADAQFAWLQGSIDSATYQCWVEMNDSCFAPFDLVTQARARKLSIPESMELFFTEQLTSAEWGDAIRANGVLDPLLFDRLKFVHRGKFSPADAVRAFHRDQLSAEELNTQLQRHGFVETSEYSAIVDLATPYLSPAEQIHLWQRDQIGESELDERLRLLGFVREDQIVEMKALAVAIPSPSDLTRMMMRDAGDINIVNQFDLDAEFEKKFKGRIPEWARAAGMEEEHLQYQWRAHWTIPPPGQLYTMLHRLRHADPGSPEFIDKQTVETALQQQDILPFWVPKLLEISTAPITRVDARRAHAIGIVDREALVKSFWDRGYSDPDAETLANYVERDLFLKVRHSSLVKRFGKLELTLAELNTELDYTGLTADQRGEIIEYGKHLAAESSRTLCTKAVKSRFKTGELTYQESLTQVIDLGFDPEMSSRMVAGWECEIKSKGKPQSAATLCRWLGNGLITATEMLKRLGKLGYAPGDAMNVVIECQQKIQGKATKEYERQLKAGQRELEKQQRIAERQAAKIAKQQAAGAKAFQRAIDAQRARDALLVKYSKIYADRHTLDITDTFLAMRDNAALTKSNWSLTADQAVRSVVLAIEQSPPVQPADIAARIDEIGESFALAEG